MNSLPLQCPGESQQYLRSLALSLLLHSLAVGAAITLLGDLKMAPQPEPFRWEVSMVEATRPKLEPQPTQSQAQPAQPTSAPVKTQPAEAQPAIRTVQVQTVQPVQQVVRQEVHHTVREVQPLVEATVPSTSTVNRTIQAVEATQQVGPETTQVSETVQTADIRSVIREEPVAQHVAAEMKTVSPPASSVVSQAIVEPGPVPIPIQEHAVIQETSGVKARSTSTVAPVQEQVAVIESPIKPASPAIQEASVRELAGRAAPAAKADYGWLAQALWDRVARLKRYPHVARVNHLEGRVVVRAVIKEDGHLAEISVAESSGHPVLDQDALEVIRRACPLKLRHPLGRPQVVVQVPINYRLEN